MMLTDLPEEIMIIIIQKLDVKSQYSLYNTCKLIRNVICMQGVLKSCCFSLNSLATAETLRTIFFKDIAYNLSELNMCGVIDLCKTKLFPALKKLKRLKVLDVSYTEMTMSDLIPIYKLCPTIKDISINFVWKCTTFAVPISILLQCQTIFENFENVKFVGSIDNLIYSRLPLFVLQKAKLHQLKFVVINAPFFRQNDLDNTDFPEFDHFALNVMDWDFGSTLTALNDHWSNSRILSMLLLKGSEEFIVMLTYAFELKIYASPKFVKFFKEVFKIEVEYTVVSEIDFLAYVPSQPCRNTGLLFMAWNKETTVFDEKFYKQLAKHVKQYMPHTFEFQLEREVPAANKYDLFYISPIPFYSKKDEVIIDNHNVDTHSIKRKRVAAPNYVLNYDFLFKEEKKVELVLHFKHPLYNGVALTNNCMYLRKLTYLSLIDLGRYSSDFFRIIFTCCDNLITLNIRSPSSTQCALAISRSIAFTKSLKNLRISENMIDFQTLFISLGKCLSLENIHISENLVAAANYEYNHIGNPTALVETLDNLYSIYIEAPLSQGAAKKITHLFNLAKKNCNKRHIRFEVNSSYVKAYTYYPFASVFKLCSIASV